MNIRLAALIGVLSASILILGCPVPGGSGVGGSLTIVVGNSISRTLLPSLDTNAAGYTVSGAGPNGAGFTRSTTAGAVTVDALAFGSWTISVNALNAAGTVIGNGTASAVVHTGQTTAVTVTVRALAGQGTLGLTVNWPASQVETPSITASLLPFSGAPVDLSFTVDGAQATCSTSVEAGYYTLSLQLNDNGIGVMGAVEMARIAAGQTTSGVYTFENVNGPGGSVQVNITPALGDPIPVTLGGVPASMTAGSAFTATASAADGTANVVWVWYVNGLSVGQGPSLTYGNLLAAGYYRVDVTGYSPDGTRAGSATANLQVTPRPGEQNPIGMLVVPSQEGYMFLPYSPTMALDAQRNIGLSMYRLGKLDMVTFQVNYTLGLTAFRSARSKVQCAPAVSAYPVEENVHPGNNMPIAQDPQSGLFLVAYNHPGQVLRAVRVNADLSIDLGPELSLSGSEGGVAAISPDSGTGKILVFGYSAVRVVHLQGMSIVEDTVVDYPNSYVANLSGMNKQSLFIAGKALHLFFFQMSGGPGIVLPVRLTSGGAAVEFLDPVTIPEATDYTTWQSLSYDPAADAVVCAYRDSGYQGRLTVLPFSAGSLAPGVSTLFGTGNEVNNTLYYDTRRAQAILVNSNAYDSRSYVRTIAVSGGVPSISSATLFSSQYSADITAAYDADDQYGLIEMGSAFFSY